MEASHSTEFKAHHIAPLSTYFVIYGALLVLTVATVGVSYMGLPSTTSIIVAMAVACVKASLVVMWFMHLKGDRPLNVLVFLSAIVFLATFFVFTMFDLTSRGAVLSISDNFELRADRAAAMPAAPASEKKDAPGGHGGGHD